MSVAPSDRFILPASPGQERLWFLCRLDEAASRAYQVACGFRLQGALEEPHLQRVLDALVDRHEALRTTFSLDDAGDGHRPDQRLRQVIAPARKIAIRPADATGAAAGERDAVIERIIADFLDAPFDLEHGPLLRACLIRESAQSHLLLLALHHAIADAWSLAILYRDFSTLHAALSGGSEPELPPLPVQFADFAAWQLEQVETPEYERHITYWLRSLSGVPPLELPARQARARRQGHHGRRLPVRVEPGLTAALKTLAHAERGSLFMVALAAYQLALAERAGQTDFAVGTPVAGRTRPELENVVGFFANTLAIRADLAGGPSFREVLRRVRARSLEAFEHQEVDFAHLVERLQPDRSLNRPPVFQVFFALQNVPVRPLDVAGLRITPLDLPASTTRFDVALDLHPDGEGLAGWFEYDDRLLAEPEMTRLAGGFQAILARAAGDPDQRFTFQEGTAPAGREPSPKQRPLAGHGVERPPTTPGERRIAGIFGRVLQREVTDAGASFFTLGGNSFKAVTLATELEREFGVTLPIEVIFESPSIQLLAAGLESAAGPLAPAPDGEGLAGSVEAMWQEEGGPFSQPHEKALEARE